MHPTGWEARHRRIRREPSFRGLPAMKTLVLSLAIVARVVLVVKPRSKTASTGLRSRATTSATESFAGSGSRIAATSLTSWPRCGWDRPALGRGGRRFALELGRSTQGQVAEDQ